MYLDHWRFDLNARASPTHSPSTLLRQPKEPNLKILSPTTSLCHGSFFIIVEESLFAPCISRANNGSLIIFYYYFLLFPAFLICFSRVRVETSQLLHSTHFVNEGWQRRWIFKTVNWDMIGWCLIYCRNQFFISSFENLSQVYLLVSEFTDRFLFPFNF